MMKMREKSKNKNKPRQRSTWKRSDHERGHRSRVTERIRQQLAQRVCRVFLFPAAFSAPATTKKFQLEFNVWTSAQRQMLCDECLSRPCSSRTEPQLLLLFALMAPKTHQTVTLAACLHAAAAEVSVCFPSSSLQHSFPTHTPSKTFPGTHFFNAVLVILCHVKPSDFHAATEINECH